MPDRRNTAHQRRLRTKLQGFIRAREAPVDINPRPGHRGRDASTLLRVQWVPKHQQPGNSANVRMLVIYPFLFLSFHSNIAYSRQLLGNLQVLPEDPPRPQAQKTISIFLTRLRVDQ